MKGMHAYQVWSKLAQNFNFREDVVAVYTSKPKVSDTNRPKFSGETPQLMRYTTLRSVKLVWRSLTIWHSIHTDDMNTEDMETGCHCICKIL